MPYRATQSDSDRAVVNKALLSWARKMHIHEFMKNNNKSQPDKPANRSEAQSLANPGTKAEKSPTNGTSRTVTSPILLGRKLVHHLTSQISESIDMVLELPGLRQTTQKQLLVAWIMIDRSTLRYHGSPHPRISQETLDRIISLLQDDSSGAGAPSRESDGNGDNGGDEDTETAMVPQPLGPESTRPGQQLPNEQGRKTPPKAKPSKRLNYDPDIML